MHHKKEQKRPNRNHLVASFLAINQRNPQKTTLCDLRLLQKRGVAGSEVSNLTILMARREAKLTK
jgi:hypothetical protein